MYKSLSNFQLESMCKKLGFNVIVIMKDEIKLISDINFKNCIINLQNSNQNGSHWCAIFKNDDNIVYFDPYGVIYPENEFKFFKNNKFNTFYNKVQIQDYYSQLCGYFCVLFLYVMNYDSDVLLNRFYHFINLFTRDKSKLKDNDKLVIDYIKEIS